MTACSTPPPACSRCPPPQRQTRPVPMTPTLRRNLLALAERHEELQHLLADPVIVGDNNRFRDLSREYAQLQPVADALASEAAARQDAQAMASDPELAGLAEEEISAAQQRLQQLDGELALLLVPRDPRDDGNLFLEV